MLTVKRFLLSLLLLFCVLLGIWVARDNQTSVELVLFGFPVSDQSLGIWLLLALFAGVLLGIASSLPPILRLRRQRRRLEKEVLAFRKEVAGLKRGGQGG